MSTYWVAGREIQLNYEGVDTPQGWIDNNTDAFLYVQGRRSGYVMRRSVYVIDSKGVWLGNVMRSGLPSKEFPTVGEAMTYVEALVALQE